jgi:hypothetical protein
MMLDESDFASSVLLLLLFVLRREINFATWDCIEFFWFEDFLRKKIEYATRL